MTRTDYMDQLKKHLKKLPHKEYQEAISFFTEYFDEAGADREADIMEELGTPKEAANEIITNMLNRQFAPSDEDSAEKSFSWIPWAAMFIWGILVMLSFLFLLAGEFLGVLCLIFLLLLAAFYLGKSYKTLLKTKKTLWLAGLAVMSLPVALPLLLFLLGVLVGLIALLLGLFLAALGFGLVLIIGGGYLIWESFTLLSSSTSIFAMGFGSGISMIGGAILLYLLTAVFAYWAWRLVKQFFKWILKRGKRV